MERSAGLVGCFLRLLHDSRPGSWQWRVSLSALQAGVSGQQQSALNTQNAAIEGMHASSGTDRSVAYSGSEQLQQEVKVRHLFGSSQFLVGSSTRALHPADGMHKGYPVYTIAASQVSPPLHHRYFSSRQSDVVASASPSESSPLEASSKDEPPSASQASLNVDLNNQQNRDEMSPSFIKEAGESDLRARSSAPPPRLDLDAPPERPPEPVEAAPIQPPLDLDAHLESPSKPVEAAPIQPPLDAPPESPSEPPEASPIRPPSDLDAPPKSSPEPLEAAPIQPPTTTSSDMSLDSAAPHGASLPSTAGTAPAKPNKKRDRAKESNQESGHPNKQQRMAKGVEGTDSSSRQTEGSTKKRQTRESRSQQRSRVESWPRETRHFLAPVQYLTAKYGNLEITHPKKALYAPNLDSRPQGFAFSGMEVVFFGTSSNVPSLWRNMSCTAVRVDKSTFLIDAGDGSLQQILRGSPFRLGSIERIFITHMHGDHVHGLAALLIFLGLRNRGAASQGKDVEMKPIHIYGPLGLRHFLRVLLSATHSGIEIGYAVHELLPRDEREQRSRLIDEFLLPHPDELPGTDIVSDPDGTWHLYEDGEVVVKAGELQHSVPCYGYVIAEKIKPGRFDREKAEELGVDRSDFQALQRGESRMLPDGWTIQSKEVMGPPRRGRKIVVLGDTYDASSLHEIGWDCDLLIHESTVLEEKRDWEAEKMGHSTASMAGEAARAMEARTLVLTHVSPTYQNRIVPGVEAARAAFGSDRVLVAEDFTRIQVDYEDERAQLRHVAAILRPEDRKLPAEEQWKKAYRRKKGG